MREPSSVGRRRSSVQWKLVGLVFIAVLLSTVVLTVNGVGVTSTALEEKSIRSAEAIATREANLLTAPMSRPASDVEVLQSMPPVQGMFRAAANDGIDPNDGSRLDQWHARYSTILSVFASGRPDYTALKLYMADGTAAVAVTRTDAGAVGRMVGDELAGVEPSAVFSEVRAWTGEGPYVSDVDFSSGVPRMSVGVPILNETTGEVGSVLIIEQRLDDVFGDVAAEAVADFQQIVIDDKGQYLLHPDPAKVGTDASLDYGDTTDAIIAPKGGAHIADGHVVAHEPVDLSGVEGGRYWSVVSQIPTDTALAAVGDFQRDSIVLAVVTLLIAAAASALVARSLIARPLSDTAEGLDAVAEGDLTVHFPARSTDEVGQMATALNAALSSVSDTLASVGGAGARLDQSAEDLATVSEGLTSASAETSNQAKDVASASTRIASDSDAVETAMEKMEASVREVSGNTASAAKMTAQAVEASEVVRDRMEKLDQSALDIGQAVEAITSISEKTNMLALNATVEAARVGEAGRGFAVVANEVKQLASQTGKVTEAIQQQVETIQGDAQDAVSAIAGVTELIEQVNAISTTIAGAVDEQNATASEVSRSIRSVTEGTQRISDRINIVAETAETTNTGATDAATAAAELSRLARELNELLARFQIANEDKLARV
ncbi:MAG: methyl-accepting chemotaxis protein [Actinomycetota bacterium]